MKKIYHLPEPKNKDIIKHIIGNRGENLRNMEREAGIRPFSIYQKKNEVHINGTEEQVKIVTTLLEDIIDKQQKKQTCAEDDMVVPLGEKVGLIMGRGGKTKGNIEMETETTIFVRNEAAYIKGSTRNKERARIKIQEILVKSQHRYKVNIPPNFVLGRIIGTRYRNIDKIKEETGAYIEVNNNGIYVSGETNNCKKAVVKIKNKVNEVLNKKPPPEQFNFILATEQCDYKLVEFDCPNSSWNGEKHFKVYTIDEDNEAGSPEDFNTEELQEFICDVLKRIQQENKGKEIKADLWCHFGHLYIGNIDEEDQSKAYKVDELQTELIQNKKESWRVRFDPAIKGLNIKALEDTLKDENKASCIIGPYIRHDFQFYTPDYSSVRAKIFMQVDGTLDSTFAAHDIDISEQQPFDEDTAASPGTKYLLCDQFETKARVNIMIVSEEMDCRLAIRTVSPNDNSKAKAFEKKVAKYLDKISTVNKEVCMPEDSELPEDYCMKYWRRCKRRIYPYGGQFSIEISEEDVMDITGGGQVESTKTDIHLHCVEWDRLLTSGYWEPEQIVKKLPQFLQFVRDVQTYVQG